MLWTTVGVGVQGGSRLAYSILIGRLAGKESLGQINILLTAGTFLVLCTPQALGAAAAKFIAMAYGRSDPPAAHSFARFFARASAMAGAILGILAAFLARATLQASVMTCIWAGVFVFTLAIYTAVKGIRAGGNQFATSAAWDVISAVIVLPAALLLLFLDAEENLLAPLVLGYLVFAISGWPRRSTGPQIESANVVDAVGFVGWTTLQTVTAGALVQITFLIASTFAEESDLGLYAAAISLATPLGLLAIVLRTSLSPSIARLYAVGAMENISKQVNVLLRTMVFALLPLFAVAVFWSDTIIQVAYGDAFDGAGSFLRILVVGTSIATLNATHLRLNNTEQRANRVLALCNFAGFLVAVVVTVCLAPTVGALAGPVGFLAGAGTSSFAAITIVWKIDAMPWTGLMIRTALGYAAIALGALLIDTNPSVLAQAFTSAAFIAAWVCLHRRHSWPRRPTTRHG